MLVRNYYHCEECGREWSNVWSEDCPHCGAHHMPPYQNDDAEERDDE